MNHHVKQYELITTALGESERACDILRGLLPSDEIGVSNYTDVHAALKCLYTATSQVQLLERIRAGCPIPHPTYFVSEYEPSPHH